MRTIAIELLPRAFPAATRPFVSDVYLRVIYVIFLVILSITCCNIQRILYEYLTVWAKIRDFSKLVSVIDYLLNTYLKQWKCRTRTLETRSEWKFGEMFVISCKHHTCWKSVYKQSMYHYLINIVISVTQRWFWNRKISENNQNNKPLSNIILLISYYLHSRVFFILFFYERKI